MDFCVICRDTKNKKAIERLLLENASMSSIKRKFGYHHKTIKKHYEKHMSRDVSSNLVKKAIIPEIRENVEVEHLKRLDQWMLYLHSEYLETIRHAKETNNHNLKIRALKADDRILDLAYRNKEMFYNAHIHTGWQKVLPVILKAVEKMPEARAKISMALMEVSRTSKETIDIN